MIRVVRPASCETCSVVPAARILPPPIASASALPCAPIGMIVPFWKITSATSAAFAKSRASKAATAAPSDAAYAMNCRRLGGEPLKPDVSLSAISDFLHQWHMRGPLAIPVPRPDRQTHRIQVLTHRRDRSRRCARGQSGFCSRGESVLCARYDPATDNKKSRRGIRDGFCQIRNRVEGKPSLAGLAATYSSKS